MGDLFPYETREPLSSRIPPGLHLLSAPFGSARQDSTRICSVLESYLGPAASLRLPGDTECSTSVEALKTAASLDISWDPVSQLLRITALWPSGIQNVAVKSTAEHRAELGIFSTDPSAGDAHEIGLGGLVAAAATDEKKEPSIIAYAIPSRHRQADSSFSVGVVEPQGLHPTLRLSISSPKPPPAAVENQAYDGSCGLHAYLTLPKTVFADRYQLADDLFMASKNLTRLRYASTPVDLEMPEYKTLNGTEVPYPSVFWACKAEGEASFTDSPFDRANLGYDRLFAPRTVFWHVEPRPDPSTAASHATLVTKLRVPVLAVEKSSWVEAGTALTILVGFGWVLFSLFFAARNSNGKETRKQAAKKQQ
ncbi:unnamed protein product [Parascedosporium putredinis]|uniref:Protein PBN1 n=1 Tax=Parascedosporium putredinis TaxID=1442378 RepID=A0A9P1HBU0_9PEZI|nr:unnamed protein product [Parascedosporium putredinis]CAI8002392.1 unnamed protein product [Parascedosporium putredinis]